MVLLLWLAGVAAPARADDPVPVLDAAGPWRAYAVLRPPVTPDGGVLLATAKAGTRGGDYWVKLLAQNTAMPPDDWSAADFDDGAWLRAPVGALRSPYLARHCVRGYFAVDDPSRAGALTLMVAFHGGAIVRLNGREIARAHLAGGAEMAEAYPAEAFVGPDGRWIALRGSEYLSAQGVDPEVRRRIESRVRRLEVRLPADGLQRGRNVLAVEIVRAPYDPAIRDQMALLDYHGKVQVFDLSWNTCELRELRLTASAAAGAMAGGARPAAVQVWNSDPMAVDFDRDSGNPAEPLRPIRLAGARNGVFSGKVVVGSGAPIVGLMAEAGDLTGEDGSRIPSERLGIRYGFAWGIAPTGVLGVPEPGPYGAGARPLMGLAERPPAGDAPGGKTIPVWVTVRVPRDARPGEYRGSLRLRAEGLSEIEVPIRLSVADWEVPDPSAFRTWVELIQCPDTTALEYQLPLWSDRHWAMIETSLRWAAGVGSRVVYVPLIAESNAGNSESFVRWIPRGAGGYRYDFSIMERYLDAVERNLGRPRLVVFNAWDRSLVREGNLQRSRTSLRTAIDGPLVTVQQPDGTIGNVMLPDYPEPGSLDLWKPLFDELRVRMRRRGLEANMALGMVSDFWASREQAETLKEASGGLPWINASHYFQKPFHGGLADFAYQSGFFTVRHGYGRNLQGWREPRLLAAFERIALDGFSITQWRTLAERCITGNVRGIGRLGADTWYAVKDRRGNRIGRAWNRFPPADWGYLNCNSSTLAPGPDGPVATQRYEALREGVQECEARICIEERLLDPSRRAALGGDLAERCERALRERNEQMWRGNISLQAGPRPALDPCAWRDNPSATGHAWFVGSGWQERSRDLYELAAEVQRASGAAGPAAAP